MQRRLFGQGDDATMGWELRMLWRKGVGSSRGGGRSVICADMREHCCAERGCVPIGGGLGGVRCRCRDASAARDARAQFQQAALTHLPYRLVIGDRLYEYLYACTIGNSHMRVIYASSTAVQSYSYYEIAFVQSYASCTAVLVLYRNLYCSTVVRAANYGSGLRATRIYCTRMSYSCTIQLYHRCTS